jgi:hypothetical protein
MGAYKGHPDYDESDPLEKLIRELVNLHKDVLGYIYDLIKYDPYLGPILGPSMSYLYDFDSSICFTDTRQSSTISSAS